MADDKIGTEAFGAMGKVDMARLLIEISEENDRLRDQVAGFSAGMREIDELNRSVETLMSAAAVGLKATKRLDERMNELEAKLGDLMSASARLIEEFRSMSASVKKMNAFNRMRFAEENAPAAEPPKEEFDLDRVLAELDARAASREMTAAPAEAPLPEDRADDKLLRYTATVSESDDAVDKTSDDKAAEPAQRSTPEPEITAENLDEALARRRAEIHALREAERRSNAVRNGSWSKIFTD